MSRSDRLFDIIQRLRSARRPMTARQLADVLEVVPRTVYRDIAALQAMRVPIEGEAGIGYVMRAGYDLPPLMFDSEEIEAIVVGLSPLPRTGDRSLERAAERVGQKIAEVLPQPAGHSMKRLPLYVSRWGANVPARIDLRSLRQAIRMEEKLRIRYGVKTAKGWRTIRPIALLYYIESVVLVAWCERRRGFRHFRVDRIAACKPAGLHFTSEGEGLRARWREQHRLP